jgi:DNA-binding transcriptional LysR family regulator
MDLRALRYFLAAAETQNLSRAAERLNVVQSALSHQIRGLEEELGAELFERHGRRIRLSAIGAVFREEAKRILGNVDQAKHRVGRAVEGEFGTLRVGFQTVACRNRLVSESLLAFRERHPDVELKLSSMTGSALLEGIRTGQFDAGFLHLSVEYPELSRIHLEANDWLLALPRNHRLAAKRGLKLRHLQGEPFIWLPRDIAPVLYDRMNAICHAGGLAPRVVQEAFDEVMMVNLVAVGMGLSFVINTAAGNWPEHMVAFRKVTDFSLPLSLCFIWRGDNGSAPLKKLSSVVARLKKELG